MTVTLELKPPLDARLRELARASGLSVEKYLASLIERSVPAARNEAAVSLLDAWAREDATTDVAEIARRSEDWTEFKVAVDRARSSERRLFP